MSILDEIHQPFRGGPNYRKPTEEDLEIHEARQNSAASFFTPPEVKREPAPPLPEPFEPKLPTLSDDIKANFAELVAAIRAEGVPFSKESLEANGRRLVAKSRAFARESRYFLGAGNLSDWPTVKRLLFQWHCISKESGPIENFSQSWRVSQHQARQIHRHWLAEEALKLGVKLLESLGSSGRIQNETFVSSLRGLDVEFSDFETRLFLAEWQNCVQTANGKELVTIDLKRAVPGLVAWMAGDRQLAAFLREPDPLAQLAVSWTHLPRLESVKNTDRVEAGAVLLGILFAHEKASLRSFCGDHFGLNLNIEDLTARRGDLFSRFRQTRAFLEEFKGQVGTEFWRKTSNSGHYQFLESRYFERVSDSVRHRRFLANAVMTRAAQQALAGDGKIIAGWRDQITLEVQSKYTVRIAQEVAQAIRSALEAAFPGLVVVLDCRSGISLANMRPVAGISTGQRVVAPSRYFLVKQMIGSQYNVGDIIKRSTFSEKELESLLLSGAIIESDSEPEMPERKYPAFFPPAPKGEPQP
jgi:hypothetical protein